MNKYFTDIMPEIRKTGEFILSNTEKVKLDKLNNKIEKLNNKINNLSEENNFLESKHRFEPATNGYMYINQTSCINNGIKSKCFKFGITDNIEKRIAQYKVGNPTFKLLYYIPLKIDMYQLENCIQSILKPHEIKKNNETLSFVSLKELKNTINTCANVLIDHICYCDYCKSKFKFDKLDKHKCKELLQLKYISPKKISKKSSKKLSKKTSKKSSKKTSKKSSKKTSKKSSKKTSKKLSKK